MDNNILTYTQVYFCRDILIFQQFFFEFFSIFQYYLFRRNSNLYNIYISYRDLGPKLL